MSKTVKNEWNKMEYAPVDSGQRDRDGQDDGRSRMSGPGKCGVVRKCADVRKWYEGAGLRGNVKGIAGDYQDDYRNGRNT